MEIFSKGNKLIKPDKHGLNHLFLYYSIESDTELILSNDDKINLRKLLIDNFGLNTNKISFSHKSTELGEYIYCECTEVKSNTHVSVLINPIHKLK